MSTWSTVTVTIVFSMSYVFESKDGNRKGQAATHSLD